MTTLEKTVALLHSMPMPQIEMVYRYVVAIHDAENLDHPLDRTAASAALERLSGALAKYDTGQSYDEMRDEWLSERYASADRY